MPKASREVENKSAPNREQAAERKSAPPPLPAIEEVVHGAADGAAARAWSGRGAWFDPSEKAYRRRARSVRSGWSSQRLSPSDPIVSVRVTRLPFEGAQICAGNRLPLRCQLKEVQNVKNFA